MNDLDPYDLTFQQAIGLFLVLVIGVCALVIGIGWVVT